MQIAFQDTNIEIDEITKNWDACIARGITPTSFGVIPFSDHLTGIPSDGFDQQTCLFGSTKLIKLSLKNKLPTNANIFYDCDKFDANHYVKWLKRHLLNTNAQYIKWGKIKNLIVDRPVFVKPSSDIKYFAGRVLEPSKSRTVEQQILDHQYIDSDITDNIICMWTTDIIDHIQNEYRVVVIDNKIWDICQYRENDQTIHRKIHDDTANYIMGYVECIQQIYSPHKHYVIDIARVGNTLKVIEYNCLNCSGLYELNRGNIYSTISKL